MANLIHFMEFFKKGKVMYYLFNQHLIVQYFYFKIGKLISLVNIS